MRGQEKSITRGKLFLRSLHGRKKWQIRCKVSSKLVQTRRKVDAKIGLANGTLVRFPGETKRKQTDRPTQLIGTWPARGRLNVLLTSVALCPLYFFFFRFFFHPFPPSPSSAPLSGPALFLSRNVVFHELFKTTLLTLVTSARTTAMIIIVIATKCFVLTSAHCFCFFFFFFSSNHSVARVK